MTRIDDKIYMKRALSLAMRGTGFTSPNPMVGCVIVKNDVVVGEGYHRRWGGPHAEVEALSVAGKHAAGSTVYVTLEPCSHRGKTPPCAPALVERGISRCVVAMVDPDDRVMGRGLDLLRSSGIDVSVGLLEDEARWLNRGFIKGALTSMPWVTIKAAVGLDGKIALKDGSSRWISGELSRAKAHLLRSQNDGILVGKGTVISDDPSLTVREVAGPSPVPIILGTVGDDRKIRFDSRTIVYDDGFIKREGLKNILLDLHRRGIRRLMVEGGGAVISSFLCEGLADELSLFIAPKIMGDGVSVASCLSIGSMEEALGVRTLSVKRQSEDLWFEGVFPCSLDLLKRSEG